MASVSVGEGSRVTVVVCRPDRQEAFVREHSMKKAHTIPFNIGGPRKPSGTCQRKSLYKEVRDLRLEVRASYSVRVNTGYREDESVFLNDNIQARYDLSGPETLSFNECNEEMRVRYSSFVAFFMHFFHI